MDVKCSECYVKTVGYKEIEFAGKSFSDLLPDIATYHRKYNVLYTYVCTRYKVKKRAKH